MWSVRHSLQTGRCSSHFLRRSRQVQQPLELLFILIESVLYFYMCSVPLVASHYYHMSEIALPVSSFLFYGLTFLGIDLCIILELSTVMVWTLPGGPRACPLACFLPPEGTVLQHPLFLASRLLRPNSHDRGYAWISVYHRTRLGVGKSRDGSAVQFTKSLNQGDSAVQFTESLN